MKLKRRIGELCGFPVIESDNAPSHGDVVMVPLRRKEAAVKLKRNFRIVVNVAEPEWLNAYPQEKSEQWELMAREAIAEIHRATGFQPHVECDEFEVCDWCGAEREPGLAVACCEHAATASDGGD